jgi:hypothetical protein
MLLRHDRSSRVIDIALVSIWSIVLTVFTFIANGKKIGIDDADIFFTYASNLANGEGLIYSPGIPRVEGYTSTLWMLLSSLVFKLGFSENIIWILSLVLFILTTLIAFCILEISLHKSNWLKAKIVYLLITSLSFSYASWMLISLMDTTLWGFLLMTMLYLLISPFKDKKNLALGSLVFLLLPFSRPESILLVPLIFILTIIVNRKWFTKPLSVYFIVFSISTISLTIFRYSYFGFPFPNTYYAKVSDSLYTNVLNGSLYFARFLQSSLFALIAFLLSLMYISWCWHQKYLSIKFKLGQDSTPSSHKSLKLIALVILSFMLITIFSGGDHFNLFRIVQPIWPFIVLIIALSFFELKEKFTKVSNSVFLVFASVLLVVSEFLSSASGTSWTVLATQGRSPIAHEFEIAENGKLLGTRLNKIFEEFNFKPTVGTIVAGGLARTYKGTIYDLMGLNNSQMAHDSTDREGFRNHAIFDKRIFLRWPVDVLLASPEGWGMDVALKGLASDNQFASKYKYGCIESKTHQISVCAYFRDEFISEIDQNLNITFTLSK